MVTSHLDMDLSDSSSLDSDISPNINASNPELVMQRSTESTVKNESDELLINMASQTTDTLNRTFADLKSKSEDVRLRASYDLYGLVATASRGMSHNSPHLQLN